MTAGPWAGRRVLVTGHTGFKGAWLSLWLERLGARVTGVALPAEDPAATFDAFRGWSRLDSKIVDLRDAAALGAAFSEADPEVIFHLAAQALVRRGYDDPAGTWAVNVLGTANVLEAARTLPSLRSVVVVTSDKVYANRGGERPFREGDRLGGRDPYSSSKAAAELATSCWRSSWFAAAGVGVATARAGNVVGGGDRGDDRLLPDVWRALEAGRPVQLRYPESTRPWQFVLEPLAGYLLLAERLSTDAASTPAAVNFGPEADNTVTVAKVVERVLSLWGSGSWESAQGTQPEEAALLQVDASLATAALGWRPSLDLDTTLAWTVDWWRAAARNQDLRRLALNQIEVYESLVG